MPEDQTIAYEPAIKNKRVETSVCREIKAPASNIFPLACPVEELKWIPEWDYRLFYSKSGVNETNCIFTEEKSGLLFFEQPLTTTWVTVFHDSCLYQILFHLDLSGKALIRFNFRLREVGKNKTSCTWHMVFTALDDEANAMEDDSIRVKLELAMTFLADALKHYCETGEMLG